ncbi:MAG: phytanoyl-CoA dioxygenase family protein [Acidimicrobiaceae bacterium]|nr:phytanoyl-CoA dioxygenase family protein [Acidimicrobiaceae bacterium]
MTGLLDDVQLDHYRCHGWLLVKNHLGTSLELLQHEVDQISRWQESGEWMHHYEMTDFGRKLARTENFTPYSPLMNDLLTSGPISEVAGELLGEPALLYKEKINYKLVGGAGFAPHQDKPAYPMVESVLSVMVAVDDATLENGCLYVSSGHHERLLEQDERGCLSARVVDELDWSPLPLRAGETLYFHALTPHRSGPNLSRVNRRALYPTYNGVSEGDLRAAYYRTKRAAFAHESEPGRVRLSLIGDFEGRPA